MILLYGAGGEPGRGEIPMDPIRYRASDDFLFCTWGSRKNYGQFVSNLSDQEKDLIYEEYEQMLEIRKEEENARLETARLVQSENKKKRAREKKCY